MSTLLIMFKTITLLFLLMIQQIVCRFYPIKCLDIPIELFFSCIYTEKNINKY